ncbi:MAG TPA: four helix bundle protein, partial [Vicinamibacterales bacterium]|nr:four helix bundle protein [Vicinamibacterales bacterium]
ERIARGLMRLPTGRGTAMQLLSASQSVAANYRAACRGRSRAEFIAKLGTVVEEADESVMWLELIQASKLLTTPDVVKLLDEAQQLRAIFAASLGTARRNDRKRRAVNRS